MKKRFISTTSKNSNIQELVKQAVVVRMLVDSDDRLRAYFGDTEGNGFVTSPVKSFFGVKNIGKRGETGKQRLIQCSTVTVGADIETAENSSGLIIETEQSRYSFG